MRAWPSTSYTVRIQWKYLPSLMPWVQRVKKHSCQLGAIVQVGRKGHLTFKQILYILWYIATVQEVSGTTINMSERNVAITRLILLIESMHNKTQFVLKIPGDVYSTFLRIILS